MYKKIIKESEVSSGNASGKAGIGSLPFNRGFYNYGNTGGLGISFTPYGEPDIKNYKTMKHSKKNLKKMKRFKDFVKEDVNSTMGNTGGMGPVVAAQPGSSPGEQGTTGSGDIGHVLGTYTKQSAYPIGLKTVKKHKKGKKLKNIQQFVNFNPMKENNLIDNFTARYFDDYDDEEEKISNINFNIEDYTGNNIRRIQLYEEYKDLIKYEMSGSPLPYWKTKNDFILDMKEWGYTHTTLNKNTDMLIVADEDLDTLKCKKAKKYGIPIYTYREAFDRKESLYKRITRTKKLKNLNED